MSPPTTGGNKDKQEEGRAAEVIVAATTGEGDTEVKVQGEVENPGNTVSYF